MLLVAALILFFIVHSFAFYRGARQAIIDKIGYQPYRVLFSLSAFAIVAMGVYGWNDFPVIYFYEPPLLLKQLHLVLMLPAFYLWVAARGPSLIKRYLNHPMLTGILIWGTGHLLANGDSRSMLLFVSMMLFAMISIRIINQRNESENVRSPTSTAAIKTNPLFDVFALVLGSLGYALFAYYHGTLIGFPVSQYYPF